MNKVLRIPFELRGIKNNAEVLYKANDSVSESGFDALPDLPFDPNLCIGYPVMNAYVKDMKSTGYRRWSLREYLSTDIFNRILVCTIEIIHKHRALFLDE